MTVRMISRREGRGERRERRAEDEERNRMRREEEGQGRRMRRGGGRSLFQRALVELTDFLNELYYSLHTAI